MEPPVDSAQSTKCILYDKHSLSARPNIDFTPTGERISVITFVQQPQAEEGTGRSYAYRAVPKSGEKKSRDVLTSDPDTNRPVDRFGPQDVEMEDDECFDYL